ncbi:hypothetical protein [Chitinophaga barathri]|uniref:Uncharacterized protein n=1 Tax=Chitinophaga barathri TaxID=1647451 RepID=A0A3N4MTD0_9BACT|nr:hypothetical protein [Chitinophaga barathri]RPD42779.1 hypothetical protein EG028_00325 [Chitinophaga barathri]
MERTYQIDPSGGDITIEVIVSTRGIAATEVSRRLKGGSYVSIIKSTEPPNANAAGMVTERGIGHSPILKEGKLDIYTIARLVSVPDSDLEQAFEEFTITCILRGGPQGAQPFTLEAAEKERSSSKKLLAGNIRIVLF